MKTQCFIDIKHTTLEREVHQLLFYVKKNPPNFDLCPVPPGFAKLPHIQLMDFKHFDIVCIQPYQVHVLLDDQIFPLPTIPCSVQIDQSNTAW